MSNTNSCRNGTPLEGWLERLLATDHGALARAITAVENDRAEASSVLEAISGRSGCAQILGITGAPGAGKSTLLNALVREYRRQDKTVGVVAVDPSSPFSGGSILGDRVRMAEHSSDPGVFVRSMSSRGHLGGLSRTTNKVVRVMDGAGIDVVIVETVGAGQSEVEVMHVANTVIVICVPGLGDEIQMVKAGILEVADILVVNKADTPLADGLAKMLQRQVALSQNGNSHDWNVPILKTTATTGKGVSKLVEVISAHDANRCSNR